MPLRVSISLEPHVKSLHLTLAYQFPNSQYSALKALVDTLDPSTTAGWELRLYSKDPRVNGKQIYKVIHPYSPVECDELELRAGDYVYIGSEALANSPDGWVEGTSWLTGCSGLLPQSYTEHTKESDAWTLHRKVALNHIMNGDRGEALSKDSSPKQLIHDSVLGDNIQKDQVSQNASLSVIELVEAASSETADAASNKLIVNNNVNDNESTYENLNNPMNSTSQNTLKLEEKPQRLFVMRHGERIDFTFGTWVPYCFDDSGNYIRKDLNMPVSLPKRRLGPKGYLKDTPLTQIGIYQAVLVGEALKTANANIKHVYCSPSFRCIQTCDAVLTGMGKKDELSIKLEPGLFEWLVWYPESIPDWFTADELSTNGFNIDSAYQPYVTQNELIAMHETCEQFYLRSSFITESALAASSNGNVLFVGHAATLDVCTHELMGKGPRTSDEMTKLLQKIPYCSLITVGRNGDKWEIVEPPCSPVTHSNNQRFDWKIFH